MPLCWVVPLLFSCVQPPAHLCGEVLPTGSSRSYHAWVTALLKSICEHQHTAQCGHVLGLIKACSAPGLSYLYLASRF